MEDCTGHYSDAAAALADGNLVAAGQLAGFAYSFGFNICTQAERKSQPRGKDSGNTCYLARTVSDYATSDQKRQIQTQAVTQLAQDLQTGSYAAAAQLAAATGLFETGLLTAGGYQALCGGKLNQSQMTAYYNALKPYWSAFDNHRDTPVIQADPGHHYMAYGSASKFGEDVQNNLKAGGIPNVSKFTAYDPLDEGGFWNAVGIVIDVAQAVAIAAVTYYTGGAIASSVDSAAGIAAGTTAASVVSVGSTAVASMAVTAATGGDVGAAGIAALLTGGLGISSIGQGLAAAVGNVAEGVIVGTAVGTAMNGGDVGSALKGAVIGAAEGALTSGMINSAQQSAANTALVNQINTQYQQMQNQLDTSLVLNNVTNELSNEIDLQIQLQNQLSKQNIDLPASAPQNVGTSTTGSSASQINNLAGVVVTGSRSPASLPVLSVVPAPSKPKSGGSSNSSSGNSAVSGSSASQSNNLDEVVVMASRLQGTSYNFLPLNILQNYRQKSPQGSSSHGAAVSTAALMNNLFKTNPWAARNYFGALNGEMTLRLTDYLAANYSPQKFLGILQTQTLSDVLNDTWSVSQDFINFTGAQTQIWGSLDPLRMGGEMASAPVSCLGNTCINLAAAGGDVPSPFFLEDAYGNNELWTQFKASFTSTSPTLSSAADVERYILANGQAGDLFAVAMYSPTSGHIVAATNVDGSLAAFWGNYGSKSYTMANFSVGDGGAALAKEVGYDLSNTTFKVYQIPQVSETAGLETLQALNKAGVVFEGLTPTVGETGSALLTAGLRTGVAALPSVANVALLAYSTLDTANQIALYGQSQQAQYDLFGAEQTLQNNANNPSFSLPPPCPDCLSQGDIAAVRLGAIQASISFGNSAAGQWLTGTAMPAINSTLAAPANYIDTSTAQAIQNDPNNAQMAASISNNKNAQLQASLNGPPMEVVVTATALPSYTQQVWNYILSLFPTKKCSAAPGSC